VEEGEKEDEEKGKARETGVFSLASSTTY